MPLNLSRLPLNIFRKICYFLPSPSILQLRQICKSIKKSVCNFTRNRRIEMESVEIHTFQHYLIKFFRNNKEEKYTLSFRLKNKDILLWKLFLYDTLKILKKKPSESTTFSAPVTNVHLIPEEMTVLLDCIKPFIAQNTIKFLNIGDNISPFIFRAFSAFLGDICVKEVLMGYSASVLENNAVLDLALKFQFRVINVHLSILSKDSLEFGFKLAEIAKKFTLWVHTKNHPQFEMISIVPEILSRNCEQLAIFNDCYTSTFSDLDIEKIIEYCLHLDKTVSVHAVIEDKDIGIDAQIGSFDVSIGLISECDLTITHLELDKES